MRFSMNRVKQLIDAVPLEKPLICDPYLDALHEQSRDIIGHYTPYYYLFSQLTMTFRPKFVVELGSWRAYGAAHFAAPCTDTRVVTVDIHKDASQGHDHKCTMNVADYYKNLKFVHDWSWDAAPTIKQILMGRKIDILFIDAWHTYEYVNREWGLYTPMLSNHALIICDDIFDAPGATENMIKFWDEIDRPKFLNYTMHEGIPMGFIEWKK